MGQKAFVGCVIILAIVVPAIVGGCASTRATSYTDPEYQDRTFSRFMVRSFAADLEDRTFAEGAFQKEFEKAGIICLPAINILPPTREETADDIAQAVSNNSVEVVITIKMTDQWVTEQYVPQTTSTSGTATIHDNGANVNARTFTTGGYTVEKPRASFEVKLVDAKNGKTIWITSAKTRGNAYADYRDLVDSLAKRTVKEILTAGLIQEPRQ